MALNTNAWNRIRYTLWAPLYDRLIAPLERMRRRSLVLLAPRSGERVLIVGAGTGKDLDYLPGGLRVVATDLTFAMLDRARARRREGVLLAVMDGQRLALSDDMFDAVVLHLIVAVIPDPVRCLREAVRVLKDGGRIVVFDKFVHGGHVPLWLRLLNIPASVLGTELTRRFDEILREARVPLHIELEESAGAPLYWQWILRKAPQPPGP